MHSLQCEVVQCNHRLQYQLGTGSISGCTVAASCIMSSCWSEKELTYFAGNFVTGRRCICVLKHIACVW
jgi:hypothetical protein